jgi:hypothetical protein
MSDEKNRITDPMDPAIPVFNFNGLPLAVLADLLEGGQAHFTNGLNATSLEVVPGLRLAPGTMVVAIPIEAAAQLRPALRKLESTRTDALRRAGIIPH